MPSPRIEVQLTQKQLLAPGILELSYQRTDGNPITYVPGQFFSLHFPFDGEEKSRSYSASGRVENIRENQHFQFVISAVPNGAASQYFFGSNPGDTIEMSGPYGALTLPPQDPKRFIFIATGTGIGPYRTMLPPLLQRMNRNPDLQAHLIFGTRTEESVLYRDEFLATAEQTPGFSFDVCYSQSTPVDAEDWEHSGRVQALFDNLQADPVNDIIYLCGNPAMVDDAAEHFKSLGFTPKNLKQEKYKFSTL